MKLQMLEDARERPDLFTWVGPVDATRLHAWAHEAGVRLHSELVFVLAQTGGGDMFESETILSPFGAHATGDNAVQANEFHLGRGLPGHLWLFHIGAFLSAVDQRTGVLVVMSGDYRPADEYSSLNEWYIKAIRAEYAERYGMRPLPDEPIPS